MEADEEHSSRRQGTGRVPSGFWIHAQTLVYLDALQRIDDLDGFFHVATRVLHKRVNAVQMLLAVGVDALLFGRGGLQRAVSNVHDRIPIVHETNVMKKKE